MDKLIFIGDLDSYKEQIHHQRKRQYKRLLLQADRYFGFPLPEKHPKESTTYMGIAIINLALAFRLSEKEEYLSEAKRFIGTVLSYEKWGNAHLVNVDLSASWILFGLSLGYDWLKPYLSQKEKRGIFQKIRRHANIMFDYKKDTYGEGWSTNYYQNHNWINMTGLAAAGYALTGECSEASDYINAAKENFERVFSLLADDGSNYEGVPYWRYGGMWLFVYAHLLKEQEGLDYFCTSNYLKNTFYYRLYQSCGDLEQQLNFGDSHDRHSGHVPCVYYKTAAEYGDGFAQTFADLVLDEFLETEAKESKIKPGILPEAVFEFLWYAPEIPKKELKLLPLVRYFEDLGLLAIREDWSRESKVLTIKCSSPGGNKQWKNGWRLYREEGIKCLFLSHHHPDNLSYIFTRGSGFLTCEDGYNRNLMPDNHNVILVDGVYTDASDVNDVYVKSAEMRLSKDPGYPIEERYCAKVEYLKQDGGIVVYKGNTTGIYPDDFCMNEVSRLLFTDNLSFFVFLDICDSDKEHKYQIISNTDMQVQKQKNGMEHAFCYPMGQGMVKYTVFSDQDLIEKQYIQEISSVMTTQEPDKRCTSTIQTLMMESAMKVKRQVFFECFTFGEDAEVVFEKGVFHIKNGKSCYELIHQAGDSPITIKAFKDSKEPLVYEIPQ